ncbi:hypothetical protein BJY00DRAFT_299373 [Aspergillus carlsbadensis]|nr:hypothetical protein BJY00DRAFT_299373 [Aspergillus carlsbadensis]
MNRGILLHRAVKLKPVLQAAVALVLVFSLLNLFAKYTNVTASIKISKPRPTVGKVMMIYGNNTVYERAVETHRAHCLKQGYPLFLLQRQVVDGVWNKLAYLIYLLVQELEKPPEERLEWLFWADSDTILTNPNMRLETFLPPPHLTGVHLVLTKDWNGMNAGVFPIRVHPWSISFLSAAVGYPIMNPDATLIWAEQSAMVKVLEEREELAQSVVYVPLRWFNAYMASPDGEKLNPDASEDLQFHPGDLLVHFPGTGSANLNKTLTPYFNIAEAHRPSWELPMEETVYPAETGEFWRSYSAEHGIAYPNTSSIQEGMPRPGT